MSRWEILSTRGIANRGPLTRSWQRLRSRSGLSRWFGLGPWHAALNTVREMRLALSFASAMVAQA